MRPLRFPVLLALATLAAVLPSFAADGFLHNGVTAHRGNSGEFPENTLPAFASAIQAGADWLELDVHRTHDGKLVVIHDKRTGRVADQDLAVAESTCEQLQALDVASQFRKDRDQTLTQCPPHRIPLLEEVLRLVIAQQKTRVSIQPKTDCVAEVIDLVRQLHAEPWVGFNDGNLAYMAQVKRLAPRIPVFWDRRNSTIAEDIPVARQHGFEAIVLHHSLVNPRSVQAIKQAGLEVGAWTVNDRGTLERLRQLGVQRFYTDFPAVLRAIQAGPESPSKTGWVPRTALTAPEAVQAAAADEQFVYAIANKNIAKYDRSTGQRVALSTGPAEHLNSGFFWQGRLYAAHSNFPHLPESSQLKVLDPQTMELTTFKDFGNYGGSLTWAVRHRDAWWCNFARYGADNKDTFLVKFDDHWRELGRWTYPPALIPLLGRSSLSGGIWYDGSLLVTDHDHRVLYRMRVPLEGKVLDWIETHTSPFPGQGIALDPKTGGLVGIDRKQRQIVFATAGQVFSLAQKTAKGPVRTAKKTVRLLTVGNSFSRNATHWLNDLVTSAGHELVFQEAMFGGASLAQHWDRVERNEKDPRDPKGLYGARGLKDILRAENWDYVTIQQYSLISHDPETYRPFARDLCAYVKKHAPQARILVHQTWAYRVDDPRFSPTNKKPGEPLTQKAMYERLTKAYEGIAKELGLQILPVGDALYLGDTDPTWGFKPDTTFNPKTAVFPSLPSQRHSLHVGWRWTKDRQGKPVLRMDGHHANLAGEYLGACVFYEMLFGENVVPLRYVPEDLDADYARFLRETAHRAITCRRKDDR